jgi:DNA-binding beta-propeller fold protein YncE
MTIRSRPALAGALILLAVTAVPSGAQQPNGNARGPIGPSPYNVVRAWHKPFQQPGYAFGGNSGVFAESPDRIFVLMRGETRLPWPVPPEFHQHAGTLGINVLNQTARRTWRNCIYTLNADGTLRELWSQWDYLCQASSGPGPHRIRIDPYRPDHPVWVINETFHQIHVFANDGSRLLYTLGEKGVPGTDATHFGRPQDVAFLPDGRILIADGLDNHRVMIMDKDLNYLGEVGSRGNGPGQFNGVHAIAVGPGGRVFALDRSGGRINVFRTTSDPTTLRHEATWDGFTLPLDIIVNDDDVWITDLTPLRFVNLDFEGNYKYTWLVPPDLPDGYLEVHTFTVDSDGNLFGGDNQYGRTQKFVPKPGIDRNLLIGPPWVAR